MKLILVHSYLGVLHTHKNKPWRARAGSLPSAITATLLTPSTNPNKRRVVAGPPCPSLTQLHSVSGGQDTVDLAGPAFWDKSGCQPEGSSGTFRSRISTAKTQDSR